VLVDANLLLYATDRESPFHDKASQWLTAALTGDRRVGMPWQSLWAFVRIATHPRVSDRPLTVDEAWGVVEGWVGLETTWHPNPGPGHARILGDLLRAHHVAGNLVTDAQLAALALEHGLTVYSADADFVRLPEVDWVNPLRRQ
jgi:uncharacterized protein